MYFNFLFRESLSNPLAPATTVYQVCSKLKPLPALHLLGVNWIFCLAHLVPGLSVCSCAPCLEESFRNAKACKRQFLFSDSAIPHIEWHHSIGMAEDGLGSFVTLIYELTIKGIRHSLPVQTREQLSGIGCPLLPGS